MNAQEMYYLDKWMDLEDTAKGLEQTARFLPKAADIPANQKDSLPVTAGDLGKEAVKLREAARTKDKSKIEESMNAIHNDRSATLIIHTLHLRCPGKSRTSCARSLGRRQASAYRVPLRPKCRPMRVFAGG